MSLANDAAVVAAVTAASRSRADERRQDRLVQAQIERDREAAREADRRATMETAARLKQEAADAREARKTARTEARRKARGQVLKKVTAWIKGHVKDLLLTPVIVVPGVLAWSAMAAYGESVYGPLGRMLPAFSEGAMWAFAVAVKITRYRDAKRVEGDPVAEPSPIWHLLLGTAVFAAFGFALNFAHGYAAGSGGKHGTATAGIVTGLVMAVISIAGVTADQIVNAGPRRTRAEKDTAKIAGEIRKRELETQMAAVRNAKVQLDSQGTARLVFAPEPEPADEAEPGCTSRAQDGVLASAPGAPASRTRNRTPGAPASRIRTRTPGAPASRTRPHLGAVTDESAEMHFAAELADGKVPSQRRIKAELHVGQDRAAQIRAHLEALAASDASSGPDPADALTEGLAADITPDDAERTVAS